MYIHFADPEGKTESESIRVFGFVVLLPLTVAGLANTNPTFAFGVASVAPHIDCIVNRQGAASEGFVSKTIAAVDTTWNLAYFLRFLGGCFVGFTSVRFVLSCLCLEAHVS